METRKVFFTKLRREELKDPYLVINVKYTHHLYEFLQNLEDIRFVDGQYHTYYGEIKVIINNFITLWSEIINECTNVAYNVVHSLDRKGLLALIQESAETQIIKQNEYLEIFGAPTNDEEQNTIDHLQKQLDLRLEDLQLMRRNVQIFDKQELVPEYLKTQLDFTISKINSTFEIIHTCIANRASNFTYRIRASLEEILLRLSNNLKKMNDERSDELSNLMKELYEANKDRLMVSRQDRHRISDTAEVEYEIKKIRDKIERHHLEDPLCKLEEEVAYWEKQTAEFTELEKTIKKIDTEFEHVTLYLERYNEMNTTEYPGSKKSCWNNMGENYRRRKEYLEMASVEARKALMTFFAVQGQDRIYYKDNIGTYMMDDYGHQIYSFDYGQKNYHLTCNRELFEVADTEKYYYDEVGRYVLGDKGEKVYQRAACCSTYNLNENDLLEKKTVDCGHSESPKPDCGLTIKDPNVFVMLPAADQVNIKQTLTPEVSSYLWRSLAHVLCDALCDTGNKQSINPIYYLANRIIYHKYHKNNIPQLRKKLKETKQFKEEIYRKRKEKGVAEAKAYKAQQVKPRPPAEFDDTETRQVLAAHEAREHLKNQYTYYDYY